MHFEVLGRNRRYTTSIELVMADIIEIKRKPNQVFTFKDPENFVNALIGHDSVVVHVGKDSEDSDVLKAYYWEPGYEEAKKHSGFREGGNILPTGSLAVLEMKDAFDLEGQLTYLQGETRRWVALFKQVAALSRKISDINRENKYADEESFEYMSPDELEKVLEEMKAEYERLTKKPRAEV